MPSITVVGYFFKKYKVQQEHSHTTGSGVSSLMNVQNLLVWIIAMKSRGLLTELFTCLSVCSLRKYWGKKQFKFENNCVVNWSKTFVTTELKYLQKYFASNIVLTTLCKQPKRKPWCFEVLLFAGEDAFTLCRESKCTIATVGILYSWKYLFSVEK